MQARVTIATMPMGMSRSVRGSDAPDGEIEIRLTKLDTPAVSDEHEGTTMLEGTPKGKRMGYIVARRGHMALLPKGAAYQFHAAKPGVILLQSVLGDLTLERWQDICQK